MRHQPRRKIAAAKIVPRSQAAYTLAGRLTTCACLLARFGRGSWVGRIPPRWAPHLRAADSSCLEQPLTLSFWDLVEAHVLRALRKDHQVKVEAKTCSLRLAGCFSSATASSLSSASGQVAMRQVFEQHLQRVDWDARSLPVRLYPFVSVDGPGDARPIAIDPNVAFGRPVVQRAGVSTRAIAERLDAGESITDLAADYDLTPVEVEQAAVYERAA